MADFLTPTSRSALMSKIRGKNTGIERLIFAELVRLGIDFSTHVDGLTGRPDIVIENSRLLVFVDGDFWHGRRYERWKHKLSPQWAQKIESNIRRDRRQRSRLRQDGWHVMRLWGSNVLKNAEKCAAKILTMQARYDSREFEER